MSDEQPLLADEVSHIHGNAGGTDPQHLCARCSSELESNQDYKGPKTGTLRRVLIIVALVLGSLIFFFDVLIMGLGAFSVLQLFIALWIDVTITTLGLLLYMGRRRKSPGNGKLARLGGTAAQIRVLCALGFSWILFISGTMKLNARFCNWGSVACGLFTTIDVLIWILMIVLFSAAYATYRRAVAIHGTNMVPILTPPMVAAWRLSDIADGEGAIKI
ncbi:hypothetical protein FB451DRAFT_1403191 [Mycena latifolia]|nr:hypothetical protein FB451DRAFT_1403191 [Mycena latifolia]